MYQPLSSRLGISIPEYLQPKADMVHGLNGLTRIYLFNSPGLYPVILPVITPVPMAAVSLLLHRTAKMIAKGFANRFLKAIDDSLKVLEQCQRPL
jgi:hypothetical protein